MIMNNSNKTQEQFVYNALCKNCIDLEICLKDNYTCAKFKEAIDESRKINKQSDKKN